MGSTLFQGPPVVCFHSFCTPMCGFGGVGQAHTSGHNPKCPLVAFYRGLGLGVHPWLMVPAHGRHHNGGGQVGGAYHGVAPWLPWCHTTPPKKCGGQLGAPCATCGWQPFLAVSPPAHHPHHRLPGAAQNTPQGAGWGACGTTAPPQGAWV